MPSLIEINKAFSGPELDLKQQVQTLPELDLGFVEQIDSSIKYHQMESFFPALGRELELRATQFSSREDPFLNIDEANSRFGIEGSLSFSEPLSELEAKLRHDHKKEELLVLNRYTSNLKHATGFRKAAEFVTAFGIGVGLDPTTYIPILGQEMALAKLGRMSIQGAQKSIAAGRTLRGTAFSFASGSGQVAAAAAVGQLPTMLNSLSEGRSYTADDYAQGVIYGAALGGVLNTFMFRNTLKKGELQLNKRIDEIEATVDASKIDNPIEIFNEVEAKKASSSERIIPTIPERHASSTVVDHLITGGDYKIIDKVYDISKEYAEREMVLRGYRGISNTIANSIDDIAIRLNSGAASRKDLNHIARFKSSIKGLMDNNQIIKDPDFSSKFDADPVGYSRKIKNELDGRISENESLLKEIDSKRIDIAKQALSERQAIKNTIKNLRKSIDTNVKAFDRVTSKRSKDIFKKSQKNKDIKVKATTDARKKLQKELASKIKTGKSVLDITDNFINTLKGLYPENAFDDIRKAISSDDIEAVRSGIDDLLEFKTPAEKIQESAEQFADVAPSKDDLMIYERDISSAMEDFKNDPDIMDALSKKFDEIDIKAAKMGKVVDSIEKCLVGK